MTSTEETYPNEYLAFRLGRLKVQLPREIENAYLIGSLPIVDDCSSASDRPHVRDRFAVLDRVLGDLETTLKQLDTNAQSNIKQVAGETLEALSEVTHQVQTGLENGDAAQLAKYFSDLIDISRDCSDKEFADNLLDNFLRNFRGEEDPASTPKRGREGAPKQPPEQDEIESPLNGESWEGLKKCIDELVSWLGESSVFFNFGRSFERACEPYRIKESAEFVGKSWNQLHRKLASEVKEQISILADLGVETSDLAWGSTPELDFETRLRTTSSQIEQRLKSFGAKDDRPTLLIPEFKNMEGLGWDEVRW